MRAFRGYLATLIADTKGLITVIVVVAVVVAVCIGIRNHIGVRNHIRNFIAPCFCKFTL